MPTILLLMRGFGGFVLDALLPALLVAFFGFGIIIGARKFWRGRDKGMGRWPAQVVTAVKGIVAAIAFLVFIAAMLFVTFRSFRLHYELWILQPQDVEEIRMGTRQFVDQPSIEAVVRDLKSSEWYSINHGGWGDETPLVLTMRSGAQWQMQVGYHFAQHGAVILRFSQPYGRGFAMGQVFSLTLPGTLEKLGAPLSHCDMAHGHPCALRP